MEKLEVLDVLSIVRDMGCCNMLDRNCIIQTLKSANEHEAANYLKGLSSQDFISLMSKDFSNYIKG
jgi:hypothetical protein